MILACLAHLVHQVLPVYSERLSLEHLAHRDHQDLLGCQEKMDTREAEAIKEVQAKKGLKDFQA